MYGDGDIMLGCLTEDLLIFFLDLTEELEPR